jgi:hypothetical protein
MGEGNVHDLAGAQAVMASPSPEQTAAGERHGVIAPIAVHIEKLPAARRCGVPSSRHIGGH